MTVGCILTIKCEMCMIGAHPERRSVHPWAGPEDIAHALSQGHADPTGKPCTCWCSRPPQRIQRRRTAGWRMPEGAVYVGRPTKWGSPYTLDLYRDDYPHHDEQGLRRMATSDFRGMTEGKWTGPDPEQPCTYPSTADVVASLAGRDLVCWCPLDQPCHADVLLEFANGGAQ